MRYSRLIFAAFLLASAGLKALQAQDAACERTGWVIASLPGCGLTIMDLDTGEKMLAISGGESLSPGQTFTFSTQTASDSPANCASPDMAAVVLVCLNTSPIPCKASFNTKPDLLNPLTRHFSAQIYDPSTQQCTWSFGDGVAHQGLNVQHTFPQEGEYDVCLKVSDQAGCVATYCQTLTITDQNPAWCDYEIFVTESGGQLHGLLMGAPHSGALKSVRWFDAKSGITLSTAPVLHFQLGDPGVYAICAEYEAEGPDAFPPCIATRCMQTTFEIPHCRHSALSDPSALCPPLYAPVCGCDGVTYNNECQAMSAGVTQWWPGPCGVAGGACTANLSHELIHADIAQQHFTFQFTNLSSGGLQFALDFGDGSPIAFLSGPGQTIVHTYTQGGIYRAELTVWQHAACVATVTTLIITDSEHGAGQYLPAMTDYVLPGDANGDQRANVYDLLPIGVGYAAQGMPRPNASTAWQRQFAPDWPQSINQQVNYKHLDGDGNGVVNEFDVDPIIMHYAHAQPAPTTPDPSRPTVRLRFEPDTLVVDLGNISNLQLTGELLVGSAQRPALGLYGLAFSLLYPDYVLPNPTVAYDQNSFLGFINHLLVLSKDNDEANQLDMGMARKSGLPANGFGRLAQVTFTLDFIIIVDIIDRAENKLVPFVVPVNGLQAINPEGKPLDLSVPVALDTVWLKIQPTVSTSAPNSSARQIMVAPNPATDHLGIYVPEPIQAQEFVLTDMLGCIVMRTNIEAGRTHQINLPKGLPSGLYTLHVRTDQGVFEQRVAVAGGGY